MAVSSSLSDQIWPNCGHAWSIPGMCWSNNSVQIWLILGRIWPTLAELRPDIGRNRPNFARHRSISVQMWPFPGPVGGSWSNLSPIWAAVAQTGQLSTGVNPVWANTHLDSAIRPELGRACVPRLCTTLVLFVSPARRAVRTAGVFGVPERQVCNVASACKPYNTAANGHRRPRGSHMETSDSLMVGSLAT